MAMVKQLLIPQIENLSYCKFDCFEYDSLIDAERIELIRESEGVRREENLENKTTRKKVVTKTLF